MDGGRRTSAEDRRLAIRLVMEGYSYAAAGRAIGRDFRTVRLWFTRDHNEGDIRDRPPRPRPRAVSEAQERAIVELATRQRFITAPEMKQALGLDCSLSTIYRYVHTC